MEVKRSYPSLKLISWTFKFLAVAMVLFGILAAWAETGRYPLAPFIGCVILGIFFLACSEAFKIFIDIEENTRRTANLLDSIKKQPEPSFDTSAKQE